MQSTEMFPTLFSGWPGTKIAVLKMATGLPFLQYALNITIIYIYTQVIFSGHLYKSQQML
jgi:hypothetical protein